MPKLPDWLLEMSNSPNLVNDTPEGDYQNRVDSVRERNARRAEEERRRALLEASRPRPVPQDSPEDFLPNVHQPPRPPNTDIAMPLDGQIVPQTDLPNAPPFDASHDGPNREYEPANPTPPPPSPLGPPLSAPDAVTPAAHAMRQRLPMPEDSPMGNDMDDIQTINHIAKLTGLPPKVVATFALVGKQLREEEERDKAAGLPSGYNGDTPPSPGGPPPIDQPPAGPVSEPPLPQLSGPPTI